MQTGEGLLINLYDDMGWKERLFGGIRLNEMGYSWQAGAIVDFPDCLILENAPWEDESFQEFWRQAILNKEIEHYGKKWKIPNSFQLVQKNGYQWEQYKQIFTEEETTEIKILNSSFLYEFIGGQTIKEEVFLFIEGCVQSSKSITALLTQELDEGQWARLLDECKKYETQLNVLRLDGVGVPMALEPYVKTYNPQKSFNMIQTVDIESCAAQFRNLVIDVTDLSPQDLFGYTQIEFNHSQIAPQLEYKPSWLIEKLKQGTQIILKGHLSKRMAEYICHEILINEELSRNLCIITDFNSPLQGIPCQIKDYSSEKMNKNTQLDHLINIQPILQFRELSKDTKQSAEKFQKERKIMIEKALSHQNFVIVTGLSGCGKTTFIKKTFYPLIGEKDILKWIQNKNYPNYLFFDEANLTANNWMMFAGLMQQPPHIVYKGQYYELSPHHKVIFAINPLSYGDERNLPKLFEINPNLVVFDPIPADALYEEILKPLLENTVLESQSREIAEVIFDIYRTVLSYSNTKILISPRECQSMVLLTLAKYQEIHSLNPQKLAKFYAFSIAQNCVPEHYRKTFTEKFQCQPPFVMENHLTDYVITSSRKPVVSYLNDLMSLRAFRQSKKDLNIAQLTGGLGGLIIEGEPGIGKSEALLLVLTQYYHLKKANSQNQQQENVFYYIPTNISISERKALLLEAFHKGAVVIIDEINSGPMLESFLNALLMGYTPEGELAHQPGFTVLATQNPVTRSGRRKQSEAMLRRIMKFNLEELSKSEMLDILRRKGIDELNAHYLICIFLDSKAYAQKNHLRPQPNFRDFMRLVETILSRTDLPVDLSKNNWTWNIFSSQLNECITQHLSNDFIELFIEQVIINPNSNINDNRLITHDFFQLAKLGNQKILNIYLHKWLNTFPQSSNTLLALLKSIDDISLFQTCLKWCEEVQAFSDKKVLNNIIKYHQVPDKIKANQASLINEKKDFIDYKDFIDHIEILVQLPTAERHQTIKKNLKFLGVLLDFANNNEIIRKQLIEFFKTEKYDLLDLIKININLSPNIHDEIFNILSDQTDINKAEDLYPIQQTSFIQKLNTQEKVSYFLKNDKRKKIFFLIQMWHDIYNINNEFVKKALYEHIIESNNFNDLEKNIKELVNTKDNKMIDYKRSKFDDNSYEILISCSSELNQNLIDRCNSFKNLKKLLNFDKKGELTRNQIIKIEKQIRFFDSSLSWKNKLHLDTHLEYFRETICNHLIEKINSANSFDDIKNKLNYYDFYASDKKIILKTLIEKKFIIPKKKFSFFDLKTMNFANSCPSYNELEQLFVKYPKDKETDVSEFVIDFYNLSVTNKDISQLSTLLAKRTNEFIENMRVPLSAYKHLYNILMFILGFTIIIPLIVKYHYASYFYTSDTDLSKIGENILKSLDQSSFKK